MKKIRLGTRSSKLARWQADWTAERLRSGGIEVEIVFITTTGDTLQGSLQTGTERGVFTKRIQQALLDDEIDLAVHSLKDLPTEPIPGLSLVAIPKREDPVDVLISRGGELFDDLPSGSVVGTGSWRRQSQLLNSRDDIRVADIRGNVDTRLKKVHGGDYDAIVLAFAGIHRLGLADQLTQRLEFEVMLPAVGQGALGLEARDDDEQTRELVAGLNDPDTNAAVTAERSMLFSIGGGCLAPVGALATVAGGKLTLRTRVLSQDGKSRIDFQGSTAVNVTTQDGTNDAAELGRKVAMQLNEMGARELIGHAREE